jgi:hypothetical protein
MVKEDQRKKLGFLESFRGIFVNIESWEGVCVKG